MRTVKPLTDKQISNAKPKGKEYSLWDGQGLHIIVKPTGSKLWRFQFTLAEKKKLMGLGQYPATSLDAARGKAQELRKLAAAGVDPVARRQEEQAEERTRQGLAACTFQAVAVEWYATVKGRYRPTNQKKVLWLLRLLGEAMGPLPIHTIRYNHIRAALRMVIDKGNVATAHKLGSKAREIFSYARRNGYIDTNPADDFTKDLPPIKSQPHAFITDEKKLGALLRSMDEYDGALQVRYALRLMPYLALRISELRGARWAEIDLDAALWVVPAKRQDKDGTGMKMRQPHIVPLSTQAVALLQDLKLFTGHAALCFPSPVGKKASQPISDMTIRNALRRMGYANKEITPHGFRHTFSTLANEFALSDGDTIEGGLAHKKRSDDWITAALAKKDGNNIRGTYNHAAYIEPRRKLMQAWADYLDTLREGKA
ncbi:MAG: integrase arm-type DNA-binding domain-containing protein [Desulfobulbaceae bacterium]|jgi:integrase|nr:integrase arm-type DNA-binding domain-containing protein [Desulfobulbaceae bacterium]